MEGLDVGMFDSHPLPIYKRPQQEADSTSQRPAFGRHQNEPFTPPSVFPGIQMQGDQHHVLELRRINDANPGRD